jgi:hypothetical protein
MEPARFLSDKIVPTLAVLSKAMSADMGSYGARLQLLTTALHEGDQCRARMQYGGGPGRSFFQFEGGTGQALDLVMKNPKTKPIVELACTTASVEYRLEAIYWAVTGNDAFAIVMARLLLWLDPATLPEDDPELSYKIYLRQWNPGKPPGQEKWTGLYRQAQQIIADGPVPTAMAVHALMVSPPASGNQVAVAPVTFKPTLRRGSSYLAIIFAVIQYLPDIIETISTGLPPNHVAAPWAPILIIVAVAMRDAVAAQGAAKVATAAVDPVGPAATAVASDELAAGPVTAMMQVQHRTNQHLELLLREVQQQNRKPL